MKKTSSFLAIALVTLSTSFASNVESHDDKAPAAECTSGYEAVVNTAETATTLQADVSSDAKENKSCCGTCQEAPAGNENTFAAE